MTDDAQLIVEPMDDGSGDSRWSPAIGPEAHDFLQRVVPIDSRDEVGAAAVSVLSRGVAPAAGPGTATGLVVGYVQSGKTMSFESAAALARDNAFQMVIVVAGSSIPLLEQTIGRLQKDFQIDDPNRERRWMQVKNPKRRRDGADERAIRDVLGDWQDTRTPVAFKKTVLIGVLKNHTHLRNLAALLRSIGMENVSALVIDDEADQASLNNAVAAGHESTTYRCLLELRSVLPCHTYLQYTATPQAPLLISIIDSLSPDFVEVLIPGSDYVGGREFFADTSRSFRVIPSGEVPTAHHSLPEPPRSLLQALRVFMVGVAAGLHEGGTRGYRSMLVHPSHRTSQQLEYFEWVRAAFDEWQRILDLPESDQDKQDLLADLGIAHRDLEGTVGGSMPSFDELRQLLPVAFRHTQVREINTRGRARIPEVPWRDFYGWILVGGQAMDRGFTVEGLTVTYMPRGIGAGNADTVQQRARFFGYKRPYLGYCRVYLEQGTLAAFQSYVDHEEDIRRQLQDIQLSGRSLDEWKRAFVLDSALRPCRRDVLQFDYMHDRFSDQWVHPNSALNGEGSLASNRLVVDNFLASLAMADDPGHADRTEVERHSVCAGVPLRRVVESLLLPVKVAGIADSQRNTGLLLQLSKALEDNPREVCAVYSMSPTRRRQRGLEGAENRIKNLFQGQNPRAARGPMVYPGDRTLHEPDAVTIQVHRLDLTCDERVVSEDVPVVAVWVPARMARAWVVQSQDGQVV